MVFKEKDKRTLKEDAAQQLIILQQAKPHIEDSEPHQMSGRILRRQKQKQKKDIKKVKSKEQSYER